MRPAHFRLLGFPVRIETNALLVAAFVTFRLGADAIVVIAAFFFSILLHELGHAMAFRRYGCSSGIAIHGMGGTTASHDAHRLTNRQHVFISLAGPLSQLVLLGLPALAAWFHFGPYGQTGWMIRMMMFVNIGWALVNLLPVYPMDGGQILYRLLQDRSSEDPWVTTRAITAGVGAGVVLLAFWSGYPMGGLLIGYIVLRGAFAGPPGGGGSSITAAAARAQKAHLRQNVKGAGREAILSEAYSCLVDESMFRLNTLKDQLERGKHGDDLATLNRWEALLEGSDPNQESPAPVTPLLAATRLAVKDDSDSGIANSLKALDTVRDALIKGELLKE